jgi:hypothetical protein
MLIKPAVIVVCATLNENPKARDVAGSDMLFILGNLRPIRSIRLVSGWRVGRRGGRASPPEVAKAEDLPRNGSIRGISGGTWGMPVKHQQYASNIPRYLRFQKELGNLRNLGETEASLKFSTMAASHRHTNFHWQLAARCQTLSAHNKIHTVFFAPFVVVQPYRLGLIG